MKQSFLDRHLGTVVMVAALAVTGIAGYSTLQSHVDELTRRTLILEQEVVPRSEHMQRDQELNQKLTEIKEQIKEVNDHVREIDNRQRQDHR